MLRWIALIASMVFSSSLAFTRLVHSRGSQFPIVFSRSTSIGHRHYGRPPVGDAADDTDDERLRHRKSYAITGTGRGSAARVETDTGHVLHTDVPEKMGGENSAPQPVEHLVAALVGCTQATATFVGRMMRPRLLIERMDFEIEASRDQRGALGMPIDEMPAIPARLQRVSGTVTVHFHEGVEVTDDQLRILGEQTEARCPVANMMHASGCIMNIDWVKGED